MADALLSAIDAYRQKSKKTTDESLLGAIENYRMRGVEPSVRRDIEKVQELEAVPKRIAEQPLPVGGEPMVGGPDVLAMEEGQTKTFMEGPEGKPVEVRRAQAITLTGKPIPEPISPDGMDYEQRAELIKQKESQLGRTAVSGLEKLRKDQLEHDARYKNWLSQMIGGGEGITPSGEKVQLPTRKQAAIKAVGDFRQQIDDIIVNDKFLDYAAKKGLTTPGFWERKLGRIGIGSEEYQNEIEQLKRNPEARKLAEEFAMTTPEFGETVGDLFGRVWDGYAGAVGSGTVGPIGLALKGIGLENVGQSLVDAADFADQMRQRGQDPRKVGELAQFGRDVASGLGFTGGAIAAGVLGNTARASLGLDSARAINLFEKANILGFSGLNSAWGGYSEARANGATDEQAKQAALFSALTQAPIELVSPLQKWIKRFDPKQQERIYKGLNKAAQAIVEGTEEALFNEMPQQIAGNLVKKFVYDPNQDIFDGTIYAGGVGGASGVMASILTQMLGVKRTQQQARAGNELGSEESDIDSEADKVSQDLAPDPESALAAQMMGVSTDIDNLKEEIANDEMSLQAFEEGTPERQQAQLALDAKKANLTQLEDQFAKLSAAPAPTVKEAMKVPETGTKEEITARIEELNKEFDTLAEEDTAGQERVNRAIFAEQNKLAELTAIEQGVEPQAVTPTRAAQPPPSGRQYPYGTFYPERPVLQAFVKAADKAIKGIRVAGKRAQKLKNAIRTNIARNAGFLAGINAEIISSEEYGKLTGGKQVAADSGTYRAAYFNGKKYLVLPDVNQLTATTIKGEQRAASRDSALDQESRAADKKLEEEMIHLSMYQALQDEYAGLKKPKQTEQQYIVSRIGQIAQEVKRTNPNAVPGVSEAYLGQKGTLDDVAFSMEFMRMVIQRVRTGQITEDLNAIRKAEAEAFSDESRGAIIALKNSILNALKFVRNSLARYLGKGTSTREVKRMENSINAILDEYGIVKGEANYEFKDYSAAQPKGEVSLTITEKATVPKLLKVFKGSKTEGTKISKGSYVSPDRKTAESYGGNVTEATIDTSNYLVGAAQIKAALEQVAPEIASNQEVIDNNYDWPVISDVVTNIDELQNKLVDAGYGGIIQPFGTSDTNGQIVIFDEATITPTEEAAPAEPTAPAEGAIEANAGGKAMLAALAIASVATNSIPKSNIQASGKLKNIAGYEKYEVGGKEYYRINPSVNPELEKATTTAAEIGANLYAKFDTSPEARIYKRVVLERNGSPITEKEFTVDELQELQIAVLNSLRNGRDYITYEDFGEVFVKRKGTDTVNVSNRWFQIVGRAKIVKDESNNVFVIDTYDFNLSQKDPFVPLTSVITDSLTQPRVAAIWLAARVVPETNNKTTGVPVKIKISDLQPSKEQIIEEEEYKRKGIETTRLEYLNEALARGANRIAPIIEAPIEAKAATYVQDFEVFNRFGENKRDEQIVVEANSVEEAKELIRQTPEYQNYQRRSREKKIKFFSVGEPRLKRQPGESGIVARAGVTPQMDRDYLAAVKRGDMETAQRMVDEAAKKSVSPLGEKWSENGVVSEVIETFNWLNEDRVDPNVFRYSLGVERALERGESIWSYLDRQMLPFFEMDMGMEREDLVKWFLAQNEKIDSIGSGESEVDIPPIYGKNERGRTLIRGVEAYAKLRRISTDPVTYDDAGNVIPLSQRFDVTTPLIARAATTPKVVSEQRRITNEMLGELNDMIATLQPKRSRAGKEYVSRTTKRGKTYPAPLVSPYSRAANLYTSNTYEESTKALNKLFTKNPDADFFTVVTEVATQTDRYGLTESEKSAIIPLLYRLLPAYREQIMESKGAIKDRENIALKSLDLEDNLAKLIVDQQQASARTLNAAKVVRQIGGAGTAVAAYKSKIIDGLADLYTIIRGDFTQLAEAVRGDRRKAVDNVFTLKEVLSRISQLKTKAEKNPQAAVNAIRKAVAGKKTRKAREIVLEFCASMFDTKGDKYANMMVDETAKAIMSIGADRKEFSSDNVYRYIYQAFAAVAKQTAKEQAAIGVEPKAKEPKKREGKFLAQVKTVIGNDKAYKEFINQLKAKIGENYQDKAQFESDYKELFSMLGDRQWSDSMRNQAIKDSADFLDYKFNDLITYIGENRYAAQAAVKAHIKAELANIGATDEQINKFIEDTQNYLDEETAKRVKKSLGFDISKETGRIIGGKIEKEAMKKVATAEERFQLAKTLKGLTKLAATDQRAFLDKLNELIITELGFDEATSQELSKYIEEQMAKAIQAQKSENLQKAIERAQETLSKNNIKAKANQRTILQRLIEMANMGQLDEFSVYEAFRQTHNFGRGYIEWNPELANQLREWGDRISALPEGVTRAIEEQKLGRFMLENQVFSARDYFSSYWYFALLSQVGTQAVNFIGSTFNLLGNVAVWSIYTKGKATGPMLRALYRATIAKEAPSRNAFGYVMQTGLNPSGIQDEKMMKYPKLNVFEGANPKNTPKWVYNLITFGDGKIDNAPSWLNATLATVSPKGLMRVMRATDAFMREAAYEARAASLGAAPFQQDAYNQSKEQAIRELASSKSRGKEKEREIIIRANEIYADQRLAEDQRIKAEADALETIYSQKPAGVVGLIASMANKLLQISPITQLFIPFTNVVANVLNENLNYLPTVGAARLAANIELVPLLKGKIKLKPSALKSPFIMGREEKAADIAIKSSLGLAAMITPVIISALTGGDDEDQKERPPIQFYATGPSDPEQSKIWKENGGTPYSIRIGDKYVSYLYTPLVIPLATGSMLADFYERFEKKQEKTPIDAAEAVVTVAVAPFAIGFVAALDQSFLTGVADLIELKEARDIPAAAENIATNIVSRIAVPGVLRDMQKMLTEEKLEGDVYMTNLLREFPGSEAFLDKKLGYFGDPARYNSIIQENGPGRRALSLIGRVVSSETPDPAFEIMYRNGLVPPKWQGSLQWSNEIRMNKAEQREFVSIAGPIMREWIIENEDIINDLPTEEAQEYVANNFSQIRRSVKADLEYEKGIGLD